MKTAIVFALAVACALAAPAAVDEKNAETIVSNTDIRPDGSFDATFQTSNGISSRDAGELRQGRDEQNNVLDFVVRSGEYSWVDPEGKPHTLRWEADQDGFRASGDDIPRV